MEAILKSTPRLLRALLLLFGLATAIYLIAIGIFKNIHSVSDIVIETNDKGGFIFKVARKSGAESGEKYAQFLLPSNRCWYNSGLDIQENEECLIRITGNVHLAFNSLNRDVENDNIPKIKWTGPDGNEWAKLDDMPDCQAAKEKLLVKPGKHIGNVVGYLHHQNIDDDYFMTYFFNNRKVITNEIKEINKEAVIKNDRKEIVRLYLCVNDILLDLTDSTQERISRIAFEGRKKNTALWKNLKKEKEYYRLWFDDNVGGFLVSVTIRKKK